MVTPQRLITGYFHQLVFGCDNVDCTTVNCRSCSQFPHLLPDRDSAALLALRLASRHHSHPTLCDGLSPVIFEPDLRDRADEFTSVIRQLHRDGGAGLTRTEAAAAISSALSNVDVFPYIMLGIEAEGLPRDLALTASHIHILCSAVSVHWDLFAPCRDDFLRMLRRLCAIPKPTFRALRGVLLAFCFPEFLIGGVIVPEFQTVVSFLNFLPVRPQDMVFEGLARFPLLFERAIYTAQTNLTVWSLNSRSQSQYFIHPLLKRRVRTVEVELIVLFIDNLKVMSRNSDESVTSEAFVNEAFTALLSPEMELIDFLKGHTRNVLSWPGVLTLRFRNATLQLFANLKQRQAMELEVARRGGAVTERDARLFLEVEREDIVNGTFQALQNVDDQTLTKRLMVVFKGEQGFDGGGVAREFFYLFCRAAYSPDYGLFKPVTGGKCWFQSEPQQPLIYFSLLGTVAALALYNSVLIPIRFPRLLYKKLNGRRLLLSDLAEIEEELFGSFNTLRAIRDRGEEIADCDLTFSVITDSIDRRSHPLKDGGERIPVTNENLDEYIELYCHYLMVTAVERQFYHFRNGFEKVHVNNIFALFLFDELDIIMSGTDISDWNEIKANARYVDGYTADSQTIIWFWEVFNGLTDDQKRQLLRFVTGSDRTPISGLSDVRLTIQRTGDPEKLPVAHTCSSILSLPEYPSKALLENNLIIAIENAEGFGLI